MEIRGSRGDHWRLEFQDVLEPGMAYELAVQLGEEGWKAVERHHAGSFGDNVFVVHLPHSGVNRLAVSQAE